MDSRHDALLDPVPAPPAFRFTHLFRMAPSGPRWAQALRATISLCLPILIGELTGQPQAGMMATLGAFVSLYASDRPYRLRARLLAIIAAAFALAVSVGVWSQAYPALIVPVIVIVAMLATFLFNALHVGPPGAYMLVLACAAGTDIPIEPAHAGDVGWLVLGGGAISWLVHMAGALVSPLGPERSAVAAAAQAIARFAQTAHSGHRMAARHAAAHALHETWAALASLPTGAGARHPEVARLRASARRLHLLFIEGVEAMTSGLANPERLAGEARRIGAVHTKGRPESMPDDPVDVPLGRLSAWELLREHLSLRSPVAWAALRVGCAALIAGLIARAFGLERGYWAMAAAVLMLHQGWGWARTLQRGTERLVGTLLGLCLTYATLALHPHGLALVAIMAVLQFTIEMLITRNYTWAVVFITAIALLIGTGGLPVTDPVALLEARVVDTLAGCGVGLLVFLATAPRRIDALLGHELERTRAQMRETLAQLGQGHAGTAPARRARRDLQYRIFALATAFDAAQGSLAPARRQAHRLWPRVASTQHLAYQILAAAWSLEEAAGDERQPLLDEIAALRRDLDAKLTDEARRIR